MVQGYVCDCDCGLDRSTLVSAYWSQFRREANFETFDILKIVNNIQKYTTQK